MKQTKISKAIALAITGAVLTMGAASTASATGLTMYNTWGAGIHNGGDPDGFITTGGASPNSTPQAWEGTISNERPLGYTGNVHLNWAVTVDTNDSVQISNADAQSRYGLDADIDTAAGAWLDTAKPEGWKHQTDVGLFQSSVDQMVTLTPSSIEGTPDLNNFGFTVFTGMATPQFTLIDIGGGNTFPVPRAYSHHGTWNNGVDLGASEIGVDDPWDEFDDPDGTTVTTYVDGVAGQYQQFVDSASPISFMAEAGQIYSIYLGGSGGTGWNAQLEGYSLDISTSAVPLPGAVWLLGSALLGMVSFGRKKNAVA